MQKLMKTTLALTLGLVGLFAMTGVSAQAAKQPASRYWRSNTTDYVRLKKTMDVGLTQKSGKTVKPLIKKKGSLLALGGIGGNSADRDKQGNVVVRASFTSGAVHYNRLKKLGYASKISIPYTKANFKPVKLKAPIRGMLLQKGTGFKTAGAFTFTTPAAFYLTLDGYLQAYDAKTMATNAPNGGSWRMATQLWKPTSSVKTSKVTVKGNTTTIDYKRPVKGLPNQKVSKHHYRLKIQDLKQKHQQQFFPVDDTFDAQGTWQSYKVNGKAYFVGRAELGLD